MTVGAEAAEAKIAGGSGRGADGTGATEGRRVRVWQRQRELGARAGRQWVFPECERNNEKEWPGVTAITPINPPANS